MVDLIYSYYNGLKNLPRKVLVHKEPQNTTLFENSLSRCQRVKVQDDIIQNKVCPKASKSTLIRDREGHTDRGKWPCAMGGETEARLPQTKEHQEPQELAEAKMDPSSEGVRALPMP